MSSGILASFYKSKRWQRCRDAVMSERHYICERCGRPAVILHHKHYLTEGNVTDPDVALNPSNLECLCMRCHDLEHNTTSATVDGIAFDKLGNLIRT